MTGAPFDPTAVSSLAEVLAEHTGGLTFVPPASSPTRTCITVTDTNPIGTIGNRL